MVYIAAKLVKIHESGCIIIDKKRQRRSRPSSFDFGGEEAVTDAAVEAFALLTIAAAEFDESLRGEGVVAGDAGVGKLTDDIIALGRQALKELKGGLTAVGVVVCKAVGIEHGRDDVDDENRHGGVAESLDRR